MRLSPFWAHVLAPALHALAPAEPSVVARRVRNAAIAAACLASLLPRHAPLGTGTLMDQNALTVAYAVVAVLAHLVKNAARGDLWAAALLLAAGVGVEWTSGGHATWGLVLGGLGLAHAGLAAWRGAMPASSARFAERDPLPKRHAGAPHFVERLAYGLATVLVFWTFITMHTKVPTGSMQPTIMGDHGPGNRYGGDRILADHMAYAIREPRRFEICVFRYPLRRDILFVKRVVGLPGETVEIREGDIWVNGQVARKPAVVQAAIWQELFPRRAAVASARPKSVANAWSASEDNGWRKEGDTALRVKPRGERMTVAAFRERLEVDDVRVGFTAVPQDVATVAVLRIHSRGHVVTMEVPAGVPGGGAAGGAGGRLTGVEGEHVTFDAVLGASARLELAVWDGMAHAIVDGREVAALEVPLTGTGRTRAEIGARAGELVLRSMRLDEDVYYSTAPGGTNAFDIPKGHYVMLGDNSRNSEDSRMWRARRFFVEGRDAPYVAEDVSPDLSGGRVRNVVRGDGRIAFTDADGLRRDLAAASVVREDAPAPMPYVPRTDFVGRAALVFWPVPPFGSSFRPRLLP